ncbi:GPI ethanolamine phosphate transferase 2 isoform X3 [Sesamum indicum]|uniref:GPI ethanolamine phosphate transferase 2 isoform X3 n=1 Tax=Sesamum indicum TaxID=4182 RepID=A0A6I9UCC1_SESIN|nr:GPI ethanolamine phosphate transferase 2 isoform X3 [Sesamum indicum]
MRKRANNYYSLTCKKLAFFTVLAVVIQIIGLSLFILGFFPVKPTLSGMSGLESFYPLGFDSTDLAQNTSALPPEKLKSLYQVIDGLPAEFVIGKDGKPPPEVLKKAMPYTQSILAKGLAVGYHAKAAPPTVTMPRLKAMVSGALGGFLDVATNFNTQAFLDDNLIAQFLRIGWKMVMLGDETWLKLFPDMFARHDGVNSFFVKDTIQVDYNVSRHLTTELSSTDWDLLILHYLGLDHVGHIGGRSSNLMGPKLMEMDEVIKRIHSSIMQTQETKQKRTLLMVVSDHGMTEGGNHGGSSYEETDSLALFVSGQKFSDSESRKEVYQVDMASTLALLFGVPIPKNNIGTVIRDVFTSLKDEQQLRILELNSWQLLRLLQTHLNELGCGRFSCKSERGQNYGPERLCCSYLDATALHESWKSKRLLRSVHGDDYRSAVLGYLEFLGTTSKWLSSRSTDKPIGLLVSGVAALLLSCLGLMTLTFLFTREVNFKGSRDISHTDNNIWKWHLEENFVLAVIFILILSMGSSSMIEEEQYIWHYMTSSLYLILLRKTIQSMKNGCTLTLTAEQRKIRFHHIYYIVAVLVSGRILRGWHQGGVNWSYLPDIAKLLEQAGTAHIKSLQLLSMFLVITICLAVLLSLGLRTRVSMLLVLVYLFPVLLILKQILRLQDSTFGSLSVRSTTMIQIIYAFLGTSSAGILLGTPWLMPLQNPKTLSSEVSHESPSKLPFDGFKDSLCVIGWGYMFSWCLLQMLLQQPINSVPVSLLLLQVVASIHYFSGGNLRHKQWVEVAALYYVGMAGHFGLGNTNTLATVDVAGAFIGISSHSTIISGILMFIITYASPMLALLSTLMSVCANDVRTVSNSQDVDFGYLLKTTVGYPCLVPLGLNSILLLAYTIVLLGMRNHLFIWSVFSPKFLYVCATTVCVYVGVSIVALTATYTCIVFATRSTLKGSCRDRLTER